MKNLKKLAIAAICMVLCVSMSSCTLLFRYLQSSEKSAVTWGKIASAIKGAGFPQGNKMNCVPPGRSSFVFWHYFFRNDICRQRLLPAVYGLGGGEDGLGDFIGGGLGVSGGANCGVFSLNCKRTDWKNGGNYGNTRLPPKEAGDPKEVSLRKPLWRRTA